MTSIAVSAAPGRARLDLIAGEFSPRPITVTESGAQIALVATTALLLAGDHIRIDVSVGPGAWLDVLEPTGTVAYDGDGVKSSWTVRARVADGGRLTWHGEPFVVAHGANVLRDTQIDLAENATVCVRETVVLGRAGERGGTLFNRSRINQVGKPLLIEDLLLDDNRELPGLLGSSRVLDTVTFAGSRPVTPELPNGDFFELAGPGAVARQLLPQAHLSGLERVYRNWSHA